LEVSKENGELNLHNLFVLC